MLLPAVGALFWTLAPPATIQHRPKNALEMRLTIAMRSGTLVEPDCRAGEANMRRLKHPGGAPVRPAGLIWRHGGLVRRASHGLSADAHPAASESGPYNGSRRPGFEGRGDKRMAVA